MTIQAIIGHYAVVHRIPMMEQFCSGLKTLGVLEKIRKQPLSFQTLFIPVSSERNGAYLRGLLKSKKEGN